MVTPGPGRASRLGAVLLLLLLVRVQALVFLFDVALVEHHDDAHHPGRHRAGGEDDEADDHEEEVVQGAQGLVAQGPQLEAHLTQAAALQVGGGAARRLALVCGKRGLTTCCKGGNSRVSPCKHDGIITKCK